jgi:sugar transferase (PEP-CTERM/EpsH1 system associated)
MTERPQAPPLIAHVIHRLAVGGLENGVVNLINHIPPERYRHTIIALTETTEFQARIARPDVAIHALHKRDGHDLGLYRRLWSLFRRLRPDVVHTRNMAALEGAAVAWAAGVPARIHGEHGWDVLDLHGRNRRYRLLRRSVRPFVQHYVTVSKHLEDFLRHSVAVPEERISQIYNGVDTGRFRPGHQPIGPADFRPARGLVIGTVGRMQAVKDPLTLIRAFIRLLRLVPEHPSELRLVMVGDGPLRAQAQSLLHEAGLAQQAWLPGARDDVPELLRGLDVFVLPSLAEGISNTILEAMATGLPVVATAVGGNTELVLPGVTGALVPADDPDAMARALADYVRAPERLAAHGQAARRRAEGEFSLASMVSRYLAVYDRASASAPAPWNRPRRS